MLQAKPVQKRISTNPLRSISLGKLILILSALFFLITISILSIVTVDLRSRAIGNLAREDARKTSRLVFQSLYSAMKKGWNKNEISDIIDRLNQTEPEMKIRVYRGEPVIRQFGEITGERAIRENDRFISDALQTGQDQLISKENSIRYIYPIQVKQECLVCHTMAKEGDINGVIDIDYPIQNLQSSMGFVINTVIAYFAFMILLLFVALYFQLKYFVAQPILYLESVIRDIILNTDLSRRIRDISWIKEIKSLTGYFNRLLSKLQDYQTQLEDLSIRDPLTAIYNRRKFDQFLDFELERSRRHFQQFSVLMLDLDNFKHINDTFGHPVGDLALREVAMILESHKRKTDILARMGGDEFSLILPETSQNEAIHLADRLLADLSETRIELPTGTTKIRGSLGVVTYPENGEDTKSIHIAMDVAMYKAKKQGKNQVATIDSSDHQVMMEVFKQGEFIRKALDEDRVVPHFQPIVRASTTEIFAYEVLARIQDGEDFIPAAQFIEIAEELGYSDELDRRIIERGLQCRAKMKNSRVKLFFNFSSKTFSNTKFIMDLPEYVQGYGVSPNDVVLEITEREALPHFSEMQPMIEELRRQGISFALDDFGSGFSSFMYLKYLTVDFVKIEGSFIRHMARDERDQIMVKNINQMAREFGLLTIGEFVEDEETHVLMESLGINYGQGYYYGTPGTCPDSEQS